MIISKVHWIVSLDQSLWLAKYTDYNSKTTAETESDFIEDYHKGLNICFFGKTMEDVRNRLEIEFV